MQLFCYGTLLRDSVWREVTGRPPEPAVPAMLPAWRRFEIPGASYPGISPMHDSVTEGGLRQVQSADEWAALDAYEGDEYTRIVVLVRLSAGASQNAYTYIYRPQVKIALLADYPHWIPRMARHFFDQWRHLYPNSPYPEWESKLRKGLSRHGLGTAWIGILHNEPIASARLREFDMGGREELSPWLAGVWVHPALRGCGIGAQLVRAVETEAQNSKYDVLHLWTPDRRHFYEQLGWEFQESVVYQGMRADILRKYLRTLPPLAQ